MKVVLNLAKKEQKALFVIFGGTGDLAQRKLYPALFDLYKRGYLKKHFAVIGTARRPWSNGYYRDVVRSSIDGMVNSQTQIDEFASHFTTNHIMSMMLITMRLYVFWPIS